AAHPHPLVRGGFERPKIVEHSSARGAVALAPREPEIAAAVDPACGLVAASGKIRCAVGRSQRPVHPELAAIADHGAPAYPCPYVCGRIELPKVVEIATIAGAVESLASKEPEIAAAVGPRRSPVPASGILTRLREHSWVAGILRHRTTAAHPPPFSVGSDGRTELPQVVELAKIAAGIVAFAAEEPEIAAAVDPGRSVLAA